MFSYKMIHVDYVYFGRLVQKIRHRKGRLQPTFGSFVQVADTPECRIIYQDLQDHKTKYTNARQFAQWVRRKTKITQSLCEAG